MMLFVPRNDAAVFSIVPATRRRTRRYFRVIKDCGATMSVKNFASSLIHPGGITNPEKYRIQPELVCSRAQGSWPYREFPVIQKRT